MKDKQRADFVRGLRELARFLAMHPEVPMPVAPMINAYTRDREEFTSAALVLGSARKDGNETLFWLKKEFSGGISLDLNVQRETVCTKVILKEEVPEQVIPAYPEQVIPAHPEQVIPAHVKEIVKWEYSSILEPIFKGGEGDGA